MKHPIYQAFAPSSEHAAVLDKDYLLRFSRLGATSLRAIKEY